MCFWGCHGVLEGGRVLGPSLFLVGFSRALPGPVAAAADKPIVLWKLDTAKKVPSCCAAPLTSGPQPPLPARPVQLAGSATVIGGAVQGVVAAQPLADLASTGSPSRDAAAIHNR